MMLSYNGNRKILNNFTVVRHLLRSPKHFAPGCLSLEFKTCVQHCQGNSTNTPHIGLHLTHLTYDVDC